MNEDRPFKNILQSEKKKRRNLFTWIIKNRGTIWDGDTIWDLPRARKGFRDDGDEKKTVFDMTPELRNNTTTTV